MARQPRLLRRLWHVDAAPPGTVDVLAGTAPSREAAPSGVAAPRGAGYDRSAMDLSKKSALVIGAGGLGGPALLTLAAGGVGRLVVIDDDRVESSNLNRQPLFTEADLGQPKAAAAAAACRRSAPGCR